MNEYYGNPDINLDGVADVHWFNENIVRIVPAYPMIWSWSLQPVKTISLHRKCARSLNRILANISKVMTIEDIMKYQLDRCGGGYTFRTMRGSNKLSIHSWGAAIDLSPQYNRLGRKHHTNDDAELMMPLKVVDIFEDEGWKWGGHWLRPDAMHFEATS